MRVLVADDESLAWTLIEEPLCREGHVVRVAQNGRDALIVFHGDPDRWDLLIAAVHLPVMPGDALAQACRALKPALPVVLLAGHWDRADHLTDNLTHVLAKPFTEFELLRTVAAIVVDMASGST